MGVCSRFSGSRCWATCELYVWRLKELPSCFLHQASYFPSSGDKPRVPTSALARLAVACPLTDVQGISSHSVLSACPLPSTLHGKLSSLGRPSSLTPLPALRPPLCFARPSSGLTST